MQKKIGKLIVFVVGFLFLRQEIIELNEQQKTGGFEDLILPYLVVLVVMVVLAFLEVKTAVLGIALNLVAGIILFQDNEKKVLFAGILAGIVTYYENISELKPLGYKKHHGSK